MIRSPLLFILDDILICEFRCYRNVVFWLDGVLDHGKSFVFLV